MIKKVVLISVLLVLSVNARAKPSVTVDTNLVNSNINDQNKVSEQMFLMKINLIN